MKGQNLRSASIHQRIRVVGCADATRWSRAEVLHCEGTTPAAHHLNTAIIDIEDVGKNRCNRPPAPQARANSVISRRGLCVKMVFNAARTIGGWDSPILRVAISRSDIATDDQSADQRIMSSRRGRHRGWPLLLRPLFSWSILAGQIECAVDQTNVAEGLRKITQHAACDRIEFFGKQAHVIAARQQLLK